MQLNFQEYENRAHFTKNEVALFARQSVRTIERAIKADRLAVIRGGLRFEIVKITKEALESYLGTLGIEPPKAPVERQVALPYQDTAITDVAPIVHADDFASRFLAGLETDSMGNKVDGTNERWLTERPSLIGPRERQPEPRPDTQAHMDQRLIESQRTFAGPAIERPALADGYSEDAYLADVRQWHRSHGGQMSLSMSEQRQAIERSNAAIRRSFPRP